MQVLKNKTTDEFVVLQDNLATFDTDVFTRLAESSPEYENIRLAQEQALNEYLTPSVKTPAEVTMRQARLVLLQAGLIDDVEAAIAGMTGAQGQAAVIEWEYSNSLLRSQPLVAQLGAVLGLTPVQLDDLFLAASTL